MIRTGEIASEQLPFDADTTLAAYQADDPTAFGKLYAHCAPEVHTQLMRLSQGNEQLSEDLTQDTFMKAFAAAKSFEAGNVRGWLNRIARNSYFDYYRSGQRVHIDSVGDALPNTSPLMSTTPLEDVVITRIDLRNYLKQIDERVPKDFSDALKAVDMLDLSYEQAAALLGIKKETLRTRVHRGRKQAQKNVPLPAEYEVSASLE